MGLLVARLNLAGVQSDLDKQSYALTEGFQIALLIGAGFVVVAIAVAALMTPRSTPRPVVSALGENL